MAIKFTKRILIDFFFNFANIFVDFLKKEKVVSIKWFLAIFD